MSTEPIEHNLEYGREHNGYSHLGIPPDCRGCAAEREAEMDQDEKSCPQCGSIDICRDGLSGQNKGRDGWVCDHCGHEWED